MTARDFLKQKFREYMNDYLTLEKLAEDNGISTKHARDLLTMGRMYHDADAKQVPEL